MITGLLLVEGTSFELEEGNAVLYAGCTIKNIGDLEYIKEKEWLKYFLHYVNKNGPYTKITHMIK
jgi:hypothetical protein